jgi:Ca2+-binding RTX toxin-like protein
VVPNYIVPDGFLFAGGGTVNFGLGQDIVPYTALPLGTDQSLHRDNIANTTLTAGEINPLNYSGSSVVYMDEPNGTVYKGNASANTLTGGANNDGLWGAAGNDVLNGGNGSDFLNGGTGNDNLNGAGGADRLMGEAGNDVLTWAPADFLNGGAGLDTLRLTAGNLNLGMVDNNRVVDIEQVNMTGGGNQTLTVTKAEVLAASSTTNQLTVLGNAGDTVNLSGVGWVIDNTHTAAGYEFWKNGSGSTQALVKVETELNVI